VKARSHILLPKIKQNNSEQQKFSAGNNSKNIAGDSIKSTPSNVHWAQTILYFHMKVPVCHLSSAIFSK
jgi:hypothetical protein